jgi:hypothetical protein
VKVGDLVRHKVCGLGVVLCDDVAKNNGDIIVLYNTNKHKKVIKSRVSWLEVISASR